MQRKLGRALNGKIHHLADLSKAKQCRRPAESRINSFPQFTYDIEGLIIHFVALFSEKKDAIPIVLLHGWPGKLTSTFPISLSTDSKQAASSSFFPL